MRIALFGAGGQLGTALAARLGASTRCFTRAEVDVTDAAAVAQALDDVGAEIVINAAAYNFVDRAEDEPQQAFAGNALGPRNLAQWCGEHAATLLHVSSDFVFGLDAAHRVSWREEDCPGPQSVYATTKLAGEQFVRALCPQHYVVRTCGLYGRGSQRGKGNFVETMLRLGRERGTVRVVDDQTCTPTSVADLADALLKLVQTGEPGLYHFTNAGETTWCGFAREIFRQAAMPVAVEAITSAQFGAHATRPVWSVLDCSKIARLIGPPRPWQEALADYLASRPAAGSVQ